MKPLHHPFLMILDIYFRSCVFKTDFHSKINCFQAATNQVLLRCVTSKPFVVNFPVEATLGEEVARNEPVFTKCERKPQSQLVKVQCHFQNFF